MIKPAPSLEFVVLFDSLFVDRKGYIVGFEDVVEVSQLFDQIGIFLGNFFPQKVNDKSEIFYLFLGKFVVIDELKEQHAVLNPILLADRRPLQYNFPCLALYSEIGIKFEQPVFLRIRRCTDF